MKIQRFRQTFAERTDAQTHQTLQLLITPCGAKTISSKSNIVNEHEHTTHTHTETHTHGKRITAG